MSDGLVILIGQVITIIIGISILAWLVIKDKITTKKENEIKKWMKYHKIQSFQYNITKKYKVDTDGDIALNNRLIKEIPFQFGVCVRDFNISNNLLTSLKGCPEQVGGDFRCQNNLLVSLEGSPKEVVGDFIASNNKLTSLEGAPNEVGKNIDISNNNLTSLKGCPKFIGGDIIVRDNKLTSLVFVPDRTKNIGIMGNPCSEIYNRLNFTTEAHIEALLTLDPNPKETLKDLKEIYPDRYEEIVKGSKELRILIGLEGEELKEAYDISVNTDGEFY